MGFNEIHQKGKSKMKKNVVILGSINCDIVASAAKLPAKGETVSGSSVDMFNGGKGANQSVQCSLLGMPTSLIGQIGNDMQGKTVFQGLLDKGINCRYIHHSDHHRTGCASIYLDPAGDNMLVYAPGANHHITQKMIDDASEAIGSAGVFLTQTELNLDAVQYGLKTAHESGAITILNPAPAIPLPDDIYPLIDYITPNETESEVYTGILRKDMPIEDWKEQTARWFIDRGVRNLCITMGEKGAFYSNGTVSVSVDAFPIKAVDTTAAGDSFHGGLAYGLINNYPIETCLKIGSACGALAAMGLGAQNSIQPLERVLSFLSEHGVRL